MSKRTVLKNLAHSIPRSIVALVIGYHSWLLISSWLPTTQWIEVPLSFYNTPSTTQIFAPETVRVLISAHRTVLHNLDREHLAVHIDTQTLQPGTSVITLTNDHLLMPRSVYIAQWSPSNVTVTIQNRSAETRISS